MKDSKGHIHTYIHTTSSSTSGPSVVQCVVVVCCVCLRRAAYACVGHRYEREERHLHVTSLLFLWSHQYWKVLPVGCGEYLFVVCCLLFVVVYYFIYNDK